ncbi:hypothetical protein DL96DRAFT_1708867 [Flagelloscypha sp. PMI_526]|nr:hypothetical protein DL96DRAFT_1708867 [Flagelloscypha sp. PMI_526]
MSFLTRLFSKPKEDDYETVLSNLAESIQKRRVKLSEIRLRERRATLLVTLYTLGAWVAYVGMWYYQFMVFGRIKSPTGKFVQGLPVVVGPIFILFIRRIVQIWYTRIGNAEEKTLRELEKTRRLKVDEIKKKTNYYSTRSLLEKYDAETGSPSSSPAPAGKAGPRRSVAPLSVAPQTPQTRPLPGHRMATPGSSISSALRPGTGQPVPASAALAMPPPPLEPPRKMWYDRVADAVLGADPEDTPASKYALICEKCFKHNGLVPKAAWERTQYTCPKCGHFNSNQPNSAVPQTPSPQSARGLPPVEAGDKVLTPTSAGDTSMMDVDAAEDEDSD